MLDLFTACLTLKKAPDTSCIKGCFWMSGWLCQLHCIACCTISCFTLRCNSQAYCAEGATTKDPWHVCSMRLSSVRSADNVSVGHYPDSYRVLVGPIIMFAASDKCACRAFKQPVRGSDSGFHCCRVLVHSLIYWEGHAAGLRCSVQCVSVCLACSFSAHCGLGWICK